MKKIIVLAFAFIALASCKRIDETKSSTPIEKETTVQEENVVKIYIDEKGILTVNGKESTLISLEESLISLQESEGSAYYSRAQTYEGDKSLQVIDLITLIIMTEN